MSVEIFECIPNISEGREVGSIDACAHAIRESGATLVHRTSDAVHHRSVFTFFGTRATVLEAALALASITTDRIDLRRHVGAHPRIGALDVLPFVPFGSATIAGAIDLAREAAARIWQSCAVPSIFYAEAATTDALRTLADVRAGGFEGRLELGPADRLPDVGSVHVHPRAGTIAVGARGPLVAYNVDLATHDLAIGRDIARALRERNGGLRSLRALAIALDDRSVQVSCNLTDPGAVDLGLVFDLVERLARARGVRVVRSELIGLLPRASLVAVLARDFAIAPAAFPTI